MTGSFLLSEVRETSAAGKTAITMRQSIAQRQWFTRPACTPGDEL
jgi:hypothetical protein